MKAWNRINVKARAREQGWHRPLMPIGNFGVASVRFFVWDQLPIPQRNLDRYFEEMNA